MSVATKRSDGGSEATHEPSPSAFLSCRSGMEEELGSHLESERSRIESLVEDLSDVDSLTIMSPKSDTSDELTPDYSAIDSVMQVNHAFADDLAPAGTDSIDSGLISRHLKPIRTRSSMGTGTPASSTREISPLTDACMSRTPSRTPRKQKSVGGKHSQSYHQGSSHHHTKSASSLKQPDFPSQNSTPESILLQPNVDSCLSSTKPPRFGERSNEVWRPQSAPDSLSHSPPPNARLERTSSANGHIASVHLQNSPHSDVDGFHSIPNTPEIQPDPFSPSARGCNSPRLQLSPGARNVLERDMTEEEAAIEEQKRMLYACIQAMEAQLQAHVECSSSFMGGTARWPAAGGVATAPLSRGGIVRPHSATGPHAFAQQSSSETLAKPKSEGHSVVITGGQTHVVGASAAWSAQPFRPELYHPCQSQSLMQQWDGSNVMGMHGGAKYAGAKSSAHPPHGTSSKKSTRAPSSHTDSKRSSKSAKSSKYQMAKSTRSGRSSTASAKGEGVRRESSDEIFAGTSSGASPSGEVQSADGKKKHMKVTTATLPKGQTAAVSQAVNEEEDVEPEVAGGCLGQFWGANRKVKKKNDIPRAPKITAPVIQQQAGEGMGVRLGCW